MRKLLLGSVCSLMLFSFAVKAECTAAPECASLGYTKTASDCPKGALKCPYGDSYFCEEVNCKIGSIYYSDNTCSVDLINGKTALGVVVYLDDSGKHGQVMSARVVDKDGNTGNQFACMVWGEYGTNIPNLPDHGSSAEYDFDSCGNTDKIIAYGDASKYPAAWAARRYVPTTETIGKWCLPAAGVLASIYNNQTVVLDGIYKLGGDYYLGSYVISSSEHDSYCAWGSDFVGKGVSCYDKNYDRFQVRPVLKF